MRNVECGMLNEVPLRVIDYVESAICEERSNLGR